MDLKLKNQTLRRATRPISMKFPLAAKILADNLYAFMKKNGGIGLAANQVGLRDSVFVMEVNGVRRNVFNPSILIKNEEQEMGTEGCLSFPDEQVDVERFKEINVQYLDENGNEVSETLTGLESRCFQHEYDHLSGVTMHDRVSFNNRKKEALAKIDKQPSKEQETQ